MTDTGALVLGIETSCDDTAAAVVAGGTEVLSSVVSSQVDVHAVYGGVVPELAGRAHLELLTPVIGDALRSGRGGRQGPARRGRHHRPRADRLAARGGERGQGAVAGVGSSLRGGQPPRGPPVRRAAGSSRASNGPWPCSSCRGATPCSCRWRARAATGSWARPSTTPPARPSTRWLGSSASGTPAARPSSVPPWPATRPPSLSPGPCSATGSTSPSAGSRPPWCGPCEAGPMPRTRTWRRRSSRPWWTCSSPRPCAAPSPWVPRGCAWPAGWRPTAPCAGALADACGELGLPAYLPSLATCTDNAAMIAAAGWWQLEHLGPTPLDAGADPNLRLPLLA